MQVVNKILCPVDFSEYSRLALRYAVALAKDNDAKLLIYHSVPDLTPAMSYLEGNYLMTVHDAMTTNANTRLDEYVSKSIPPDVSVIKMVGEGNPAESIVELCKQQEIDLVIMGTHGLTGYERFLMGSVTNRVLHKCSVPVLVVSKTSRHFLHEEETDAIQIRRILCPVDFDMNNTWIAGVAMSFAKKYGSQIIFLHSIFKAEEGEWESLEKSALKKMESISLPAREENCDIRLEVRAGEPGEVILRTANSEGIDLIVMGHHTRKPLEEVFLGSIAKRVVTNSNCPVLVARTLVDVQKHNLVLI